MEVGVAPNDELQTSSLALGERGEYDEQSSSDLLYHQMQKY